MYGKGTGNIPDLIVGNYTFQTRTDFKRLGTSKNITNNAHNEIILRIQVANKEHFAPEKLSKLLTKKSKTNFYLSYLRSVERPVAADCYQ